MGPFIARLLLWFIFGWVIYETIHKFNKLFNLSLNPYLGIIPTIIIFVFQEYSLRKWSMKEDLISPDGTVEQKNRKFYSVITWLLIICFMLFIIIVWLGAIFRQITEGI